MYKHVVQMYLDSKIHNHIFLYGFSQFWVHSTVGVSYLFIFPNSKSKMKEQKSIRKSQKTANWFKEDFLFSSCARFHKNWHQIRKNIDSVKIVSFQNKVQRPLCSQHSTSLETINTYKCIFSTLSKINFEITISSKTIRTVNPVL